MDKKTIDKILMIATLILVVGGFIMGGVGVDKLPVSACLIIGGLCWLTHVLVTSPKEEKKNKYFK